MLACGHVSYLPENCKYLFCSQPAGKWLQVTCPKCKPSTLKRYFRGIKSHFLIKDFQCMDAWRSVTDRVLLCWYGIPHAATLPCTNELQDHLSPCKNNAVLTTTPPGSLAAYTTRWAALLLYTFTSILCHHLIIHSLLCEPRFPPCSLSHLSMWLTSHARFMSASWPSG